MYEAIIMKMEGHREELMTLVAPYIYRQQVHLNRKNNKVLYVKLNIYLYGHLRSVLLFYRKLSSDLKNKGFSVNLFDPCASNKIVNGKK